MCGSISATPMQVSFPHIQTVVEIGRTSTAYKTDEKEICYYLSSEPFDRRTPEQWLELVRGHWGGVEIRNHWRKDATLPGFVEEIAADKRKAFSMLMRRY